ncbi:cupin domain-containing protein [Hymenobacter sp. IS2118]|uniref:cupin domain-containing protein n=1 Tax=Hymenobacter sp. IS2118 TaxID=1505605 RepID=UPI0009075A40|nr:cupin domain-containing protein [Hymenobacter sp. IS2118]
MKRRAFLVSAAIAFPAVAAGKYGPSQVNSPGKGFKVPAGEGRRHGHIKLQGVNANIMDVKVSGRDTAGALAIFEQTSLSPKRGTPLHVHAHQDEVFQVLAGEYVFRVGSESFRLKTGDIIFLPRAVPHAWTQVSERGKMYVIFQPAGKLEEFFLALASLTKEPTQGELAQIFAAHDMQVVGPPLSVE